MGKDKRPGVFIPGATGEADESESVVWEEVAKAVTEAQAGTAKDRDIALAGIKLVALSMARKARAGLHANPGLVIFGNPKKWTVMARRVFGIEYRHKQDGQDYRHDFEKPVTMYALPNGDILFRLED